MWPVWRALELLLTYLDPLSFQPSPGHASEYTASIERFYFEGKPEVLACCRFCSSHRILGVGEAPGCEGNIGSIESHKQPKPECGRRGRRRVEPPSHCWTLEGLWVSLQLSGIEAFLYMGNAPISYHRGQESYSNSKFTSFQNLIISSPEKLTASFSYYERLSRHLTKWAWRPLSWCGRVGLLGVEYTL